MGSPASSVAFYNSQLRQFHCPLPMHLRSHTVAATCSIKRPRMEQFYKPSMFRTRICYCKDEIWEFFPDSVKNFPWEKVQNVAVQSKKKLWAFVPDSVKIFPWEKAESVAVRQLLVLGKEALKWSLIGLFFLSSISDIICAVLMNKELVIPFGLFLGCMMTDFLKETSQEFILNSKEGDAIWKLLGISCLFAVLKMFLVYFPVGLRVFLCHAANGGILEALWHYRNLVGEDKDNTGDFPLEENSMTTAAEDQGLLQS